MSPSVLRQSGRKRMVDGAMFTPRAMVHFCKDCGYEGASFGASGEWWCGYQNGTPVCVGKGTK